MELKNVSFERDTMFKKKDNSVLNGTYGHPRSYTNPRTCHYNLFNMSNIYISYDYYVR